MVWQFHKQRNIYNLEKEVRSDTFDAIKKLVFGSDSTLFLVL